MGILLFELFRNPLFMGILNKWETLVNLIDAEKLADLKEKVNPKNYMTPYNPDKVALANELYAILSKEGLTYNEMADVEEKSKQL